MACSCVFSAALGGVSELSENPDSQRKTAISSHFSLVLHKSEMVYKRPRSLFSTGFAGVCMRGGQMVVRVVNSAEKTEALMGKGNWPAFVMPQKQSSKRMS